MGGSIISYQDLQRRRTREASVLLTPDIYQWYQQMQVSHRVYFDPAREAWLVFRYDDVQQVLLDTRTFSSQRSLKADGTVDPILSGSILGMDPPRHHQLRALVAQAFTSRIIARLEPRITEIVHRLLTEMQTQDEVDLVDSLAFPLPILVIAELLGVPSQDQQKFRQWSADFVGTDFTLRMATAQKIAHYFQSLIEERRKAARPDLLSAFIGAEIEGVHLPDPEILGLCLLLLIAGHETTTGLISNTVVCLDEHPHARQTLLQQPDLITQAIEEVVRYRAVVHTLVRVATADTILADQHIRAGDLVLPLFASANLDETHFPHANQFDIMRTPNRHLGFGYGIHFCLGAPLARLETKIAISTLLERFQSDVCALSHLSSSPVPSSTIYDTWPLLCIDQFVLY
jgi:cytochrome P450